MNDKASKAASLEARSRTKQHDYTVPNRLNQLPSSPRERLKQNQTITIVVSISNKAKLVEMSTTIILVAVATILFSSQVCRCDTTISLSRSPPPPPKINNITSRAIHKEHLLSYLSDKIEQKHFKIKPSLVFHKRPSKFDSGEDDFSDQLTEVNFLKENKPISDPKKYISIKADEDIRHIMNLHEQASSPTIVEPLLTPVENGKSKSVRDLSPASFASVLGDPNKLVSNFLSYVSPHVASKLFDQTVLDQRTIQNISFFAGLKPRLNPFSSRSNKNADNKLSLEHHKLVTSRPIITEAPQNSYLIKPNFEKYTTQPSAIFDFFGDSLFGPNSDKSKKSDGDLMADSSSPVSSVLPDSKQALPVSAIGLGELDDIIKQTKVIKPQSAGSWLKNSANQLAYNSLRDLLTLSQLPILTSSQISTAPSVLEKNSKQKVSPSQQSNVIDELLRYAHLLATGVRRKKDPLLALAAVPPSALPTSGERGILGHRSNQLIKSKQKKQMLHYAKGIKSLIPIGAKKSKPRGVMWDMATDPALAVTVINILEKASVALPLGFLLMPFVKMVRNPLNGVNLGDLLPPRASHRSVDYEELIKRLDVVDRMLSRALRSTHRESFSGK